MAKTAKGLLIQSNGDHEYRDISLGTGADDIRNAVGGNFDWTDTTSCSMYCYEYALYEQPVNPLASLIYWEDARRNGRKPMRMRSGKASMPLSGSVLVMGPPDGDGYETEVPQWAIDIFSRGKEKFPQEIIDAGAIVLDPAEIPGPQITPQVSPFDKLESQLLDGNRRQSTLRPHDS